jgi:hypothetical protein
LRLQLEGEEEAAGALLGELLDGAALGKLGPPPDLPLLPLLGAQW